MAGSLQMTCYADLWFWDFQDLPVLAICACAVTVLFSCCRCHDLFLASSIRTVTALICCSLHLRRPPLLVLLVLLLLLLLLWLRLLRPSRTDQARRNVLLDAFFQVLCCPSNVALLTCTAEKVNDVTHVFCWKYVFLARVEHSADRKSADRLAVGKSINRSPVDPIPESSWRGAEPRKAYDYLVLFTLLTSAHRLAFQGLLYNTADNRSRVAILLKNRLQRLHFTVKILWRADLPCALHKWANKGDFLAGGRITVLPRVQARECRLPINCCGEHILLLPDSFVHERQLPIILILHRKMQWGM